MIHDDDMEPGLPCAWVPVSGEDVRPATVVDVRRDAGGIVRGLRARDEHSGGERTFSRSVTTDPFSSGRMLLFLGRRDPDDVEVTLVRERYGDLLRGKVRALTQGFEYWDRKDDAAPESDIASQFQIDVSVFNKIVRLCGTYGSESYDGSALVFYEDEVGDFYEVSASHCSCYGLEGQWVPEKVSLEYIRQRAPAFAGNERGYGRDALVGFIERLWGLG